MKKYRIEDIINLELWTSRNDQIDPMRSDKSEKDENVQAYPQDQYYTVDTIMQLIDHIKSL